MDENGADAVFGIGADLDGACADEIRTRANAIIRDRRLSPRKLIEASNVAYICTTDDPATAWNTTKKLARNQDFHTKVVPAFRTIRPLT
jgi:glucuronate isomerase